MSNIQELYEFMASIPQREEDPVGSGNFVTVNFIEKVDNWNSSSGLSAKQAVSDFLLSGNAATLVDQDYYIKIADLCEGVNGRYPKFLSSISINTNPGANTNNGTLHGNNTKTKYGTTYNSFSGTDLVAYITLPLEISDGKPIVIGNLQTISYSRHREVSPVRTLGSINPIGWTAGPATTAGSMIFTMFDHNLVYDIQAELLRYLKKNNTVYNDNLFRLNEFYGLREGVFLRDQFITLDMMPEFNIFIAQRNEYIESNAGATMVLEGVVIVDEGQVMSIEDIITENTVSFMARRLRPLYREGGLA